MTTDTHTANTTPSAADGLKPVFNADIGGTLQPAVDERELYRFLGVKRYFSNWIKRRITECGLVEGSDYLLTKIGEQLPSGTKYRFEYCLKLDVAKELSMVEKNQRGREARRYFIDCEPRLTVQWLPPQPQEQAMPEAEDGFPLLSDALYLFMLINQRALFVFCREYVPFLSDPDLTAAEVKLSWQALDAYFNQISDRLSAGVDEVLDQTEGGRRAKKQAVAVFVGKWWPRRARRFAGLAEAEGGLHGKP
jgi:phage anti-repressor protein